jgi:hypothetical protein
MILILVSVATLFGHGHRSISRTAPFAHVCESSPFRIRVERPASLDRKVADNALAETAAVWRPLGCMVEWANDDSADAPASLRVVFTEDEPAASSPAEVLGWIVFPDADCPEPLVHVSTTRARRLLATRHGELDLPPKLQDLLLARVLGRALAHELGHYLLASRTHTPKGLMRARFTVEELAGNTRGGFGLEPECRSSGSGR